MLVVRSTKFVLDTKYYGRYADVIEPARAVTTFAADFHVENKSYERSNGEVISAKWAGRNNLL